MFASQNPLDEKVASGWNMFQVAQARRFVFSAHDDFSVVTEAIEDYVWHKRLIEQLIPARMRDEPHLNKREPHHKRWIRF